MSLSIAGGKVQNEKRGFDQLCTVVKIYKLKINQQQFSLLHPSTYHRTSHGQHRDSIGGVSIGGCPQTYPLVWFKPMSCLVQIRPHRRDEGWSTSLWQTFFPSCVGANIPALAELPLSDCGFRLTPRGTTSALVPPTRVPRSLRLGG